MNWRRGFFRLWLLTSILWIVAVSIFIYAQWPEPSGKTISRAATQEEDATCVAKLSDGGPATVESGLALIRCASHEEYAIVTDYSGVKIYAAVGIGLPILWFGIGLAAGWVIGGFKS